MAFEHIEFTNAKVGSLAKPKGGIEKDNYAFGASKEMLLIAETGEVGKIGRAILNTKQKHSISISVCFSLYDSTWIYTPNELLVWNNEKQVWEEVGEPIIKEEWEEDVC